jgi:hypothetical protein
MGRGRRRIGKHVAARPQEPLWAEFAVARYAVSFSDDLVATEIASSFGLDVSAETVSTYLEQRRDVVRRARLPLLPFRHPDASAETNAAREMALRAEAERRRGAGDSPDEVRDWIADERARYAHIEHFCYSDDELFNSAEAVAALIRRIKKWHRAVGRPVAGEGFEDLLASTWNDLGLKVLLAPRNYDGADAHVEVQNQWVAMSMKSEARANPSARTIRLTSLAPHHLEIKSAGDCCLALADAVNHLIRYDRMIYLRSTKETFPSDPERAAHRYTLLELPHDDIIGRLLSVAPQRFAHYFEDADAAAERNTFAVPISDPNGKRLFTVSVSRRPPRVTISVIEFNYCALIASYWTEPVQQSRISTAHALRAEETEPTTQSILPRD